MIVDMLNLGCVREGFDLLKQARGKFEKVMR